MRFYFVQETYHPIVRCRSNLGYFLLEGSVALSSAIGVPFRSFAPGATVGELEILNETPRPYAALTTAPSKLHTLSRQDFSALLESFPTEAHSMRSDAVEKRRLL